MSIFVAYKTETWEKDNSNLSMLYPTNKRRSMYRFTFVMLIVALCSSVNAQEYRSFDGSNNNNGNMEWGASGSPMLRVTDIGFEDGVRTMAGQSRPNPRTVSNAVFSQVEDVASDMSLSDVAWVFGQFIEHDMVLLENDVFYPIPITVPSGDDFFEEGSLIRMFRSATVQGSGLRPGEPLQFYSSVTAFIDGSAIYGVDESRVQWLRSHNDGKMRMSEGDLLPWNTITGEFNDAKDPSSPFMFDDIGSGSRMFVSGDPRANKHPLLIAMHTVFVREHNRICDVLKSKNQSWPDEKLFLEARKRVCSILQNIVFNEWLPTVGVNLPAYKGYDSDMNPGLFHVYAAAASKQGNTMMSQSMVRMDNEGEELSSGNLGMKDAFYNPISILEGGGVNSYLKGMATQVQQEMDCKVVDDVRNYSLGEFVSGGLDLAAIDINRGRDIGLPDYNTIRDNFGLPRIKSFRDITKSTEEAANLESLYGSVDNIDPWVGMTAEFHLPNSTYGQLVMRIMREQFQNVRDGDRFYFENDESLEEELDVIRNTKLSDVILRNSDIAVLQENIFVAMEHDAIPNGPELDENQLESVLYPNPTGDRFTIKMFLEVASDVSVRIFDPSGRLVKEEISSREGGVNFMHFDLGGSFPKGLYNINIEAGYSYKILRLVKE